MVSRLRGIELAGRVRLVLQHLQQGIHAFKEIVKEIASAYWLNEKRLRDHKITLIGEKSAHAATQVGRGKR